jgi:hypothetical protein
MEPKNSLYAYLRDNHDGVGDLQSDMRCKDIKMPQVLGLGFAYF